MSELALHRIREAKHKRLTRLDLGNCDLVILPEELFELTWLEELYLSSEGFYYDFDKHESIHFKSQNKEKANCVRNLNQGISLFKVFSPQKPSWENLINLKILIFRGGKNPEDEIREIGVLKYLINLEQLDISRMYIRDLTPLKYLSNLRLIDISLTQINDINPLRYLGNLKRLNVSWTKVKDLSVLQGLENLETLYTHNTQVSDLSPIKDLINLKELDFSDTKMGDLNALTRLKNLRYLNFDSTLVTDISLLKNLSNLEDLWLNYTTIDDLSPLSKLLNLQHLYIAGTKVSNLTSICNLLNLKGLDVSSTLVNNLSPIANLINLEYLSGDNTEIADLSAVSNLLKLKYLLVPSTKIIDLSPLRYLENLKEIGITETQISDLSPLKNLKNLTHIHIEECPIINPPKAIAEQGIDAIRSYFEELETKGKIKNNHIKLVLLGNSTVGKTSLSRFMLTRQFIKNESSTHGIKRDVWRPSETGLSIKIWDFGGQEYYHATHRLFLNNKSVYVLVVSEDTNFYGEQETEVDYGQMGVRNELLEHFSHTYWLDTVQHYAPDSSLFLVQNKSEYAQKRLVLNEQTVEKYHLERNPNVYHLSIEKAHEEKEQQAKGRWLPSLELFEADLIARLKEAAEQYDIIVYYPIIRDALWQLSENQKVMTYAAFQAFCLTTSNDDTLDFNLLEIYLRNMVGVILYYPNNALLKDRVWLDADWLHQRIYKILNLDIKEKKGQFDKSHVIRTLACSGEEADEMIALMCEFDLIFKIGNAPNNFITPQYLGDKSTIEQRLNDQLVHLRLEKAFSIRFLDFLPSSIIAQFIAKKGQLAIHDLFWKTGLLYIEKDKSASLSVLVECDSQNNEIIVKSANQNDKTTQFRLLKKIFDIFYKDIVKDEYFHISLNDNHFIKINDLKDAIYHKDVHVKSVNGERCKTDNYQFLFSDKKEANNMKTVALKAYLTQLVRAANEKEALDTLYEWTSHNDDNLNSPTIQLTARYNRLQREVDGGLADPRDAKIDMARITQSLNALIENVPTEAVIQVAEKVFAPIVAHKVEIPPTPEPPSIMKILFIASNPTDQTRLQTDLEHRVIKAEMERGSHRDRFEFLPPQFAVTITELLRAMNDKPQIVHFSGHGAERGIIITDDNNDTKVLPTAAISRLFRPLKDVAKVVLLNACYSANQAEEISKFGCYVVGYQEPIGDKAAIGFAKGLYNGLGEGKFFEDAYNDAMIVLLTEAAQYADIVEVWKEGKKLAL